MRLKGCRVKIKSQQFTKEILRQLQEYTKDVVEGINDRSVNITEDAVKELRETSPKDSGDYAKNWRVKSLMFYNAPTRYTIFNKDYYRLTHVLEHGHAINGGTGRSQPQVHIKPVEEKTVKAYIKAVEEVIKNGG